MRHIERGKILLVILTVIAAAFIWYYFTKVYAKEDAIRGTLVQERGSGMVISEMMGSGTDL